LFFWKVFWLGNGYPDKSIFPGFTESRRSSVSKEAKRVVVERSAFDETLRLPIIRACLSDRATAESRENDRRIGRWSSPIERIVGRDSERLLGLAGSRNPSASASSGRRKARKNRLGTLFDLDYDLLLYDVTSTYFEGLCERNPQAQRGYSRDKRGDCKQVCIGRAPFTASTKSCKPNVVEKSQPPPEKTRGFVDTSVELGLGLSGRIFAKPEVFFDGVAAHQVAVEV